MSEMKNVLAYKSGNKKAIIVLHEIYGINDFMKDCCWQYHKEGYDVYCPNLYDTQLTFPYSKSEEAYHAYLSFVTFDAYLKINEFAYQLRQFYETIIVIGFSAGATLGWRCSESSLYDGVICCYGSRIRDYTTIVPQCPVLLTFAKEDSFDVSETVKQLCGNHNVAIELFEGKHGFADSYSPNYSHAEAERWNKFRKKFLTNCTE